MSHRLWRTLLISLALAVLAYAVLPDFPPGVALAAGIPLAARAPVDWNALRTPEPLPPRGASTFLPFNGADAAGHSIHVDPCNCFESVNYLLTGDLHNFLYRTWKFEILANLDNDAAWSSLEASLQTGDVVEFIAHTTSREGLNVVSACHAQLCAHPGGIMVGANNEPRFLSVNGIPCFTKSWDACTSHEFYRSLLTETPAWQKMGYTKTYSLRIYRAPTPPSFLGH